MFTLHLGDLPVQVGIFFAVAAQTPFIVSYFVGGIGADGLCALHEGV